MPLASGAAVESVYALIGLTQEPEVHLAQYDPKLGAAVSSGVRWLRLARQCRLKRKVTGRRGINPAVDVPNSAQQI
jgi:hypothetical protein